MVKKYNLSQMKHKRRLRFNAEGKLIVLVKLCIWLLEDNLQLGLLNRKLLSSLNFCMNGSKVSSSEDYLQVPKTQPSTHIQAVR